MPRKSTKPTFEAIQVELVDPNYRIRKNAVSRMARYYRVEAVEPLLNALQDGRGDVRARIVQVLTRLHDPRAFAPMQGLLADKHLGTRMQVVRALGIFGDLSVVPLLIDLLADPKSQIRQAAARSLGKLRDSRALPLLLAYLAHVERDELSHITLALSDFDDACVIEPLLTLLERREFMDLGGIIAEALGRMGDQAASHLLEVLADPSRTPNVRACVVLALGKQPRPAFLQPLLAVLGSSDCRVREYAAQALGVLKDLSAISPLRAILDDQSDDSRVRASAITALSLLGATDAIESLITCLSSPNEFIVYTAVKALGDLHVVNAIQPLVAILFQPDRVFAYDAVGDALCKLGDPSVVDLLLQRLPTSSSRQCWTIVHVLMHFSDSRIIEPLIALLDPLATDSWFDEEVQKVIIGYLGKLGDTRAIQPLSVMLDLANAQRSRLSYALRRALIALGASEQLPV
ncbi:MAG: HEAT repeat domain-containing protein [Ktedonobacteraceae bacterium]